MTAKLTFFPVGNGDMTLVVLESGRRVLIDVNIRAAADDHDDDTPNVAEQLRDRLERDSSGRLFVDAFLLSHPDEDHCRGLTNHFHLGLPADWSKSADRIFIREIWSSPMVFRRASKNHVLCNDAVAFCSEARRRVKKFRDTGGVVGDGDRILILGEDEDGKTDDLEAILIRVDEQFNRINGQYDATLTARLLAPQPKSDDDEEEMRSKNHSSTILNLSLMGGGVADVCRFLTGGDAEVAIWERLWDRHFEHHADWLSYDILQAPHHCSWHSLSYQSWGENGDEAIVCEDAKSALGQAREGALIVASSKPIKDDGIDPPCIGAKHEYQSILEEVNGVFKCVGEHPTEKAPEPLEYEINHNGPKPKARVMAAASVFGAGIIGRQPLGHG
nr:F39 [uncultured bacterium]